MLLCRNNKWCAATYFLQFSPGILCQSGRLCHFICNNWPFDAFQQQLSDKFDDPVRGRLCIAATHLYREEVAFDQGGSAARIRKIPMGTDYFPAP
jgi:hypothetical protein